MNLYIPACVYSIEINADNICHLLYHFYFINSSQIVFLFFLLLQ